MKNVRKVLSVAILVVSIYTTMNAGIMLAVQNPIGALLYLCGSIFLWITAAALTD